MAVMPELVGAWKLTGAYFIAQDSGQRLDLLGADPFGYAVLESQGRMIAFLSAGGREGAEPASLYKSMIAYTGRWSADQERFVTQVDGAWDPSWVGTEQVRFYTAHEDTLSLRTSPFEHPAFPGQKVIGYVDWQRATQG